MKIAVYWTRSITESIYLKLETCKKEKVETRVMKDKNNIGGQIPQINYSFMHLEQLNKKTITHERVF